MKLIQLPATRLQICHRDFDNLVISVTDFPDDQMMDDMGLESHFELLGLFEGQGISERFSLNIGNETNRITLFRRPILDYWTENDETLGDIITHVLIQEIGRNFGLSDDTLDEIEEAVV